MSKNKVGISTAKGFTGSVPFADHADLLKLECKTSLRAGVENGEFIVPADVVKEKLYIVWDEFNAGLWYHRGGLSAQSINLGRFRIDFVVENDSLKGKYYNAISNSFDNEQSGTIYFLPIGEFTGEIA